MPGHSAGATALIVLPADPVPIIYARPKLYSADSIDYIGTGQTTTSYPQGIPVISQEVLGGVTTDNAIVPQPVGPAMRGQLVPTMIGLDPKAQMPLVKAVDWQLRFRFCPFQAMELRWLRSPARHHTIYPKALSLLCGG